MLLSKEIEMQTEQGETVTASYEVFDDELKVYLPDGSTRATLLRGLTPKAAAMVHLKAYILKAQKQP